MIPVDQEFVRDDALKQAGDCMRATIASLLELPIVGVPHFLQKVLDEGEDSVTLYDDVDNWLETRGWIMQWQSDPRSHFPGRFCYISGPSPNIIGGWHACVGQVQPDYTVKLIHDPHPSRNGLLHPEQWTYSFLTQTF